MAHALIGGYRFARTVYPYIRYAMRSPTIRAGAVNAAKAIGGAASAINLGAKALSPVLRSSQANTNRMMVDKRVMTTPNTGRQKILKRNYRFISTGRHSGFVRGYKRFKRAKPYAQRYKRALKGVTFQWERTVELTDDRCVFITHHNMPYLQILKAAVYALTKKFLRKMNIEFTSWTDPLAAAFIPDGTTFTIEWRQNYTGAVTIATCQKAATDNTFKLLADRIYLDIFITKFLEDTGVGFDSPAQLLSMETNISGNVTRMNLRGARIDCITKSSLKLQNRSINATDDDEADDVNNVPLIGKSYEGKGNGFISNDNTTIIGPADGVWGWSSTGAGANTTLQEPPQPYHFQYANKVTKVNMQPGSIKTSVLNGKLNMFFDQFIRYCRYIRRSNGGSTTFGYTNLGRCRMFALERTIAKFGTELSPGIQVAGEVDFKLFLDINLKAAQYTAPDNLVL